MAAEAVAQDAVALVRAVVHAGHAPGAVGQLHIDDVHVPAALAVKGLLHDQRILQGDGLAVAVTAGRKHLQLPG